jgi:hypothetical protein
MGIKFKRPTFEGQYPLSPVKDFLDPIAYKGLTCSFCHCPVELHNSTEGTELHGMYKGIDGDKTHFQRVLRACQDCCLRIQPTTDRYGDIIRSNMRFPEGD